MLSDPEEDYKRGFVPFFGVIVRLDSRPLIPRTETEYWAEKAIEEINSSAMHRTIIRVLDLFAGSGAIGLAVLKHIPNAHVTFAEKEERHFPTIRRSIRGNGIDPNRADFIKTDVWHPIINPNQRIGHRITNMLIMKDVRRPSWDVFDVVVANPPYVSKDRGTASASTLAEEPGEALFAPDDGFFYIEKTTLGLSEHLAPRGICFIEHEPYHEERLKAASPFNTTAFRDQYGVVRYSRIERKL